MNVYLEKMEEFYVSLAEVAREHGYLLHLVKEEAYPLAENGERLSEEELRRIWGDNVPSWKWYYNYFFEDRDPVDHDQIIHDLIDRGYRIDYTNRYRFSEIDSRAIDVTMFSGKVVLKLRDRWFAIGECTNLTAQRLFCSTNPVVKPTPTLSSTDGRLTYPAEPQEMCIDRLWKPLFVIKNLTKLQRKSDPSDRNAPTVRCIDCGKEFSQDRALYCIFCDSPESREVRM